MPQLDGADADLRRGLGDFLARDRTDGVFHTEVGGPGSVPALAGLDAPELHAELLPEVPTDTQRAALVHLGYVPETDARWWHPGGWRLVLPDHGSGWRSRQHALRALLIADPRAALEYRRVYGRRGRDAADRALEAAALEHHVRTVGWRPMQFAARALAHLDAPWMVAGGLALDLHAGRVTRPHDDIDIVLPSTAQEQLPNLLRGWRLDASVNGSYQTFTPPLELPAYQIHGRHPDLPDVLMLDVMLTDLSGGVWHYRRDPTITRPLQGARRVGDLGIPYLAPEIVLLFKAGSSNGQGPRGKDAHDFERALPTLDAPARTWLHGALHHTRPGHPWLERLTT
ncbi:hypothetical protein E7T09_17765 [Deinococcus sp. KSM4-11]|uniref:nucleotidyltransferase domain-containing protein n=1 Tax=Deinococcus sp. KSM4-11 TaxID=2568654 RepID=UPI0010A4FD04|nr:hypothetical protein [Deinococcus sp. KSM4-11]THF85327.1 hypothetical protein E7T09_17765 [Deinococcus sp. KSM4-11]